MIDHEKINTLRKELDEARAAAHECTDRKDRLRDDWANVVTRERYLWSRIQSIKEQIAELAIGDLNLRSRLMVQELDRGPDTRGIDGREEGRVLRDFFKGGREESW